MTIVEEAIHVIFNDFKSDEKLNEILSKRLRSWGVKRKALILST